MPGGPSFASDNALTPEDTEYMSKIAFNRGFYDRAVDWAKVSVIKAKNIGTPKERLKTLKNLLCLSDYELSSYLSEDSQAALLFWVQPICNLAFISVGNNIYDKKLI